MLWSGKNIHALYVFLPGCLFKTLAVILELIFHSPLCVYVGVCVCVCALEVGRLTEWIQKSRTGSGLDQGLGTPRRTHGRHCRQGLAEVRMNAIQHLLPPVLLLRFPVPGRLCLLSPAWLPVRGWWAPGQCPQTNSSELEEGEERQSTEVGVTRTQG